MPYPHLLKSLALRVPVLSGIVRERDSLRQQQHELARQLDIVSSERDMLRALVAKVNTKDFHPGYCHCCRQDTLFHIKGEWLRDEYLCVSCGSIPRQRHLQLILDTQFPNWTNLVVHESSPTNTFLSRWCGRYSASQYFDGVSSGSVVEGVQCQNLERLSFEDESIDLFITQDVLEHVFHPQIAAAEIARVLKPGGAHVFTVPRLAWIDGTEPRAKLTAKGIEYLKEATYHGNPVGDGRALVTWDYGADFEKLMDSWSGLVTTTYSDVNPGRGIDGEFRDVFVSRKAS